MLRRFRLSLAPVLALILSLASAPALRAQDVANLIADHVELTGTGQIVASGNVVIWYGDTRLSASRISYDDTTGQLVIDGPITMTQGTSLVILADSGELSQDLRDGIMQSARVMLDQQLQIAANELTRVDGRYTQATKVVASSCQVCLQNPVPLWSIRASRVIHDEEEQQLYFENAQFRVLDLPIFYLPRMRVPDPGNTRSSGFLQPTLTLNSSFGTAVRLPYFLTLGDHADVTLTPFVSAETATLELQYRQMFTKGELSFQSAISRDTLLPDEWRAYLFGQGRFDLKRDYELSFHIELVSDEAYLLDYDYTDKDRLDSAITLQRVRRDELISANLTAYQTLRASEIPISGQLAFLRGDLLYEKRFEPDWALGGFGSYQFSAQGHVRSANADILGRDMARVGTELEWGRDWTLTNGMVLGIQTQLSADAWFIAQDSTYDPEVGRLTTASAVSLSWPMARQRGTATEVFEPIVQLAWADSFGGDVPNEDSLMVEFDEANLFDISHFAGSDAYEDGLRANLGATWTRYTPEGWSFTLAGGKVLRFEDTQDFSDASGLDGTASDWLLAGQLSFSDKLFLQSRALLADDFTITKAETVLAWTGEDISVTTGYNWIIADMDENRPDPIQDLTLAADYQINPHWAVSGEGRYNIADDQVTRASLGLQYANECVTVDLSLSRRFTSSINVTPSTDFGLGIVLTGWGGNSAGPARSCAVFGN